jgi:thioesterase domain-containing protein
MGVSVLEVSPEQVILGAPLAPNINHLETVFGGSASALGILAAWSLLQTKLTAFGLNTSLVIQRNSMRYAHPIAGNFTAKALGPSSENWALFARTLQRKNRARITLSSTLWYQGKIAGTFEGDFVALGI